MHNMHLIKKRCRVNSINYERGDRMVFWELYFINDAIKITHVTVNVQQAKRKKLDLLFTMQYLNIQGCNSCS